MKKYLCIVAVLPLLPLLLSPAYAAGNAGLMEQQEEMLGTEDLERWAERNGGIVEYGTSLDDGLSELLRVGKTEAGGAVRRAVRSGVLLLIILMLCGLAEATQEGFSGRRFPVTKIAGTLAVAAIAITDVNAMLGAGRAAMENVNSFANVLLPVVAALTAATGAVSSAVARQMATVVFGNLLINLIGKLLIPLLYGYVALSVAYSATENPGVKRMAALIKKIMISILTLVMFAFISYLSLSGVIAGGADAAAIKLTKFTIASAIPVLGGILSDAAESILVSAGVLKGTVGIFGALTAFGICLAPLVRMAVNYLVYQIVAAISAVTGSESVCGLVEQIGNAMGIMMGMTGASCLLLLISLVSSVSVISI